MAGSAESVAVGRLGAGEAETNRPLAFVLVGTAVLSLGALGVLPRWPGLVQEVALPPLDLFADVRVLVAGAPSYPVFVLGLAVAILVRAGLLMLLVGAPSRPRYLLALRFETAALVPAFVAAGFEYAAQSVLYHWYFWIGFGLVVLSFFLLASAPWTRQPKLGASVTSAFRSGLRAGTLAGYLLLLVILGAVAHAGGHAWSVLLVPVSLLLSVWASGRLSRRPTGSRPAKLAAVTVAGLVAVAVSIALVRGNGPVPHPPTRPGSLFLVPGVDSASGLGALDRLDPRPLGFSCRQVYYFSYVGSGPGARQGEAACPIRTGAPYHRRNTQRPLSDLVAAFREQVRGLPSPVTVVTHSQGAWIAWAALSHGDAPTPVRRLAMLATFPRGVLFYPSADERGPGRVGADVLRLLAAAGRGLGISTFDPEKPLARELLATPGTVERLLARPLPAGIKALAVQPLFDLPLMPEGRTLPYAENACPVMATHVGMVRSAATARAVDRFLDGKQQEGCPPGAAWLSAVSAPFGMPPSDT